MASREELIKSVDLAQAGDWDGAHAMTQRMEGDALADWLHALLHKIEGDEENARYWYARVFQAYEDFSDPSAELAAIRSSIDTLKK